MCRVEGCRQGRGSTGLCAEHYAEDLARRALERFGPRRPTWPVASPAGDRAPTAPEPPAPRPACSAEGCVGEARTRGMCSKHWQRDRKANLPPCTVDGCERNQAARGLCGSHYGRFRRATL